METISIIGMIAALCLLSFLVMKGVNIFIAAIASAFVVALTGACTMHYRPATWAALPDFLEAIS